MPVTSSVGFDAVTHPQGAAPLPVLAGANAGTVLPTSGHALVVLTALVPLTDGDVHYAIAHSVTGHTASGSLNLGAANSLGSLVDAMHAAIGGCYGAPTAKGWHVERSETRAVDPITRQILSTSLAPYLHVVVWSVCPVPEPTVPGVNGTVGTYPRVSIAVGVGSNPTTGFSWSCWANTGRLRVLSGHDWDAVSPARLELVQDVAGPGYPYYAYPYGLTVFPGAAPSYSDVKADGSITATANALGERQSLLISQWGYITTSTGVTSPRVALKGTIFGPMTGTSLEKDPMTGFTLSKLYTRVYSGQPDKYLRLVIPGHATGKKLGFHYTASPEVRPEWIAKMSEVPRATPAELTDKLAARPVFLIPGREGRIALLFGHKSWKDPVLCLNPGFVAWQQRALTPEETTLLGRSQDRPNTMSQSDCLWYFGPQFSRTFRPYLNGSPDLHPEPLAVYRKCVLGQGIKLMHRQLYNTAGYRGTEVIAYPASGAKGSGVITIHALYDSPYYDSNLPDSNGWPMFMLYSPGLTFNAGKMGLNAADPTLQSITADLAATAKPLTDLLKVAVAPGSTLPFAFGSSRIGFVTGLPHDTGPIMVELAKVTDETNGVGAEVSWASIDLTGAQHKKMFPVSSLPSEKQAEMTAKLAAIPDSIIFRTVMVPGGIKFSAGITADKTQAAIDAVRAGGTIQEIVLTDLEDPTKPLTYGDLMAATDKAISSGKNGIVMSPLAMDAQTLVSTAAISAIRSGTGIILQRAGADVTPAQALIAIRSGATVTVPSGMTLDEVAVTVFGYPTWAAVLAALPSGAEGRAYLIDELANTNDLRFNMSADEHARGIPLLLGIDRVTTASIVGSQMLGVTAPELP